MKKKVKMCCNVQKNFQQGYEEYVLDMKARNLRDGTIRHYEQSIKQIYKRIPPDTPIESFDEKTVPNFIIQLREDPKLNEVSLGTYSRDLNMARLIYLLFLVFQASFYILLLSDAKSAYPSHAFCFQ